MTSIRRGFAGGGFEGGQSLPKQMAQAAQIPGADLIPDTAELFLGFTSTQRAGMGPGAIANFETLGYVDFRGSDYFRQGTHMHLSHIHEDVEAWYLNFDFDERVSTAFKPNLDVKQGTQTVRQGPQDVSTEADVHRDYRRSGRIGHSAAIQTTSRLQADHVAADGTVYVKGTAIPVRADFNTLDNPFAWSERADEIGVAARPPACTSSSSTRPATTSAATGSRWTATCPAARSRFEPRDRNQGFNSVLSTTHRQNFIVPPRRHRSFPLSRGVARVSAEERARDVVPLVGHGLQLRRRLAQRDGDDVVAAQRRHLAELACLDEVGRLEPEARREDAVVRGRRAAALHVPEHGHARLEAGAALDLVAELLADAALGEQLVAELVDLALVLGARQLAAFADDDDREVLAVACRRRSSAHTSSMSTGRSGIRITSAPPAMPLCTAIQPVWRPITSTTMTRLCDSAVVCSRSIASVQIATAVSKPNV